MDVLFPTDGQVEIQRGVSRGLEWSLPPRPPHLGTGDTEKQTGDLWPLAVAGAEQVSGSHNIIPKHGLSRININWLSFDNNCLKLMRELS